MLKVFFFYDLRQKLIAFFRDYSFLLPEAKYKAKYEKGLKILTSKYSETSLKQTSFIADTSLKQTLFSGTDEILVKLS